MAAVSPRNMGLRSASFRPSATSVPSTMTQPTGASGLPRAISTARRMYLSWSTATS
jgi:hypothetical protein